ncbi:unnamed protein product [Protopolystoma xenopodis]|uniref:Uncharacterized protein n=1 Tax=Protopolystoma xenopodis TaxID=117903 RepID=A0A448XFU2_9PLAT|nr:unnamed protein product [Protopolystoma xenopodis]
MSRPVLPSTFMPQIMPGYPNQYSENNNDESYKNASWLERAGSVKRVRRLRISFPQAGSIDSILDNNEERYVNLKKNTLEKIIEEDESEVMVEDTREEALKKDSMERLSRIKMDKRHEEDLQFEQNKYSGSNWKEGGEAIGLLWPIHLEQREEFTLLVIDPRPFQPQPFGINNIWKDFAIAYAGTRKL